MDMPSELGYDGKIGNKVYEMTKAGVSVKDMFESCQVTFGSKAPAALATFYKYYRGDMSRARAEINEMVGNKVVQQALEGDFKSDELEEAESAIDALKRLLGKD